MAVIQVTSVMNRDGSSNISEEEREDGQAFLEKIRGKPNWLQKKMGRVRKKEDAVEKRVSQEVEGGQTQFKLPRQGGR